jgi:RNA polymerase sigma factor (sigma-70 family)
MWRELGTAMMDTDNFAELICRIRSGDQAAAAEIVTNYESLIRREVRMRLEDARLRRVLDSMDVVQSVMASFFVRSAIGEYDLDDPRQLVRLLISMTKNKVASAARREYRQKRDQRRTVSDDAALLGVVQQAESPSEIASGKELIARARELLGDDERQMAELRSQGQSWDEIAQTMGGTAQARRVQFSRAVDRVSKSIGIDEEDND